MTDSAFLEVKDGRFVLGVWFLACPGLADVMVIAFRDASAEWRLRWRLREYLSELVWDGADRRTEAGVAIGAGASEARVLEAARVVASVVAPAAVFPERSEVLIRSAAADEVMRTLLAQPWVHARTAKREDVEAVKDDPRWPQTLLREGKLKRLRPEGDK